LYNIQTSFFALFNGNNGISIARYSPQWFKCGTYLSLCPSIDLVYSYKNATITKREYASIYYDQVLSKLDPLKVATDLNNKVMLCWENYNYFCHRFIVAKWLENTMGIKVKEWDDVPF